jgi:hypothetical protein
MRNLCSKYPGLTVLVLHHERKASAEDHQDRVSGTTALTGMADCSMSLSRKHEQDHSVLEVSGRLVGDPKAVIVLNKDSLKHSWKEPGTFLRSQERLDILRVFEEHPEAELSPKDVEEALGKKNVRMTLVRMHSDGEIERVRRGWYKLVRMDPASTKQEPQVPMEAVKEVLRGRVTLLQLPSQRLTEPTKSVTPSLLRFQFQLHFWPRVLEV